MNFVSSSSNCEILRNEVKSIQEKFFIVSTSDNEIIMHFIVMQLERTEFKWNKYLFIFLKENAFQGWWLPSCWSSGSISTIAFFTKGKKKNIFLF